MTQKRWTPADLALAKQARDSGKPANQVAAGHSYQTKKEEQQEQMWFMEWCEAQRVTCRDPDGVEFELRLDTAVVGYPGGLFLSGDAKYRAMQWGIFRKMGCKKGVSDLVLNVPAGGFHGMHIRRFVLVEACNCRDPALVSSAHPDRQICGPSEMQSESTTCVARCRAVFACTTQVTT